MRALPYDGQHSGEDCGATGREVIDVQSRQRAERYRVRGIPTLLLLSGCRILNPRVGALSYESLRQMVDHFLDMAKPAGASVH